MTTMTLRSATRRGEQGTSTQTAQATGPGAAAVAAPTTQPMAQPQPYPATMAAAAALTTEPTAEPATDPQDDGYDADGGGDSESESEAEPESEPASRRRQRSGSDDDEARRVMPRTDDAAPEPDPATDPQDDGYDADDERGPTSGQAQDKPMDFLSRVSRSRARNKDKKAQPGNQRAIFETQDFQSYGDFSGQFPISEHEFSYHIADTNHQPQMHGNVTYDQIVGNIRSSGVPERELASAIMAIINDGDGQPLTDLVTAHPRLDRKKVEELIALTQVIETHDSRQPGWDKAARAMFRAIADGQTTFEACFGRARGMFLPGHNTKVSIIDGKGVGGQAAARIFMGDERKSGDPRLTREQLIAPVGNLEMIAGYFSESSADEG